MEIGGVAPDFPIGVTAETPDCSQCLIGDFRRRAVGQVVQDVDPYTGMRVVREREQPVPDRAKLPLDLART